MALVVTGAGSTVFAADEEFFTETYRDIPTPPEFHVEQTELDGPVFADSAGKTLYQWPLHKLRNGYSGEPPGTPQCYDQVLTVTAGLMSPYPPGIKLPELDRRLSCVDLGPGPQATMGTCRQWTSLRRNMAAGHFVGFDEQPLYTSIAMNGPRCNRRYDRALRRRLSAYRARGRLRCFLPSRRTLRSPECSLGQDEAAIRIAATPPRQRIAMSRWLNRRPVSPRIGRPR